MSGTEPFPILQTERLTLREMRNADAPDILRIGGDDRVMRTYDLDNLRDEADAAQFILKQRYRFDQSIATRWAIALKTDDKVIGWCGYTPGVHYKAEVGYALARAHWGHGFASEALHAVIQYVFQNTQINRLEAVTHPHNSASSKILRRAGFSQEGLLRHYGHWRGEFHDMEMHSLLRSDLQT